MAGAELPRPVEVKAVRATSGQDRVLLSARTQDGLEDNTNQKPGSERQRKDPKDEQP